MAHNHSGSKRRHLESSSSDEAVANFDSWARFLMIEAKDHQPIKLNPFAISKAIHGYCGDVKNVTRLPSGSLLVECVRKQQSLNLLSVSTFANVEVVVTEHRTLNSCRGIVRDRTRSLSDMSEQEIADELENQGVSSVKRFTRKKDDSTIEKTNTYLFTFCRSSLPQSIKAGYVNIGVEVYVPNPLRCFRCQHFGHGSKSCTRSVVCQRCGDNHDSTDCQQTLKCVNCDGKHMASSKLCPVWQNESKILKIKCEKNVTFGEARQLFQSQSPHQSTLNYSAAISKPVQSSSVSCQTELTWVKSDRPVATTTDIELDKSHAPTLAPPTTSTAESQTPPDLVLERPATESVHRKKNEKKKSQRNKSSRNLDLSEVPIHNSYSALDMEVTPSSQHTDGSSQPSRSRERSPIEPP
ncbi:uncharacterized protein LOC125377301 [Haliotis rufescens]|uniref:uncharacterized protein LOC125377301 n=1 Tax=Haliotis rufescens TaxID=6454 RepID=UPI00201ED662|nr:uncharacterized protein LOC125377301 [Haliotis rufescens]